MPRHKKESAETENSNSGLNISKKLKKHLPPDFYDNHASLSEEELKNKLASYEQGLIEYEKALAEDPQITTLKEQLKEEQEDYKNYIKEFTAKVHGVIKILEDRGSLATSEQK